MKSCVRISASARSRSSTIRYRRVDARSPVTRELHRDRLADPGLLEVPNGGAAQIVEQELWHVCGAASGCPQLADVAYGATVPVKDEGMLPPPLVGEAVVKFAAWREGRCPPRLERFLIAVEKH